MIRPWSLALALIVLTAAPAAPAERMTDEQVKKLIEDIDGGYDTWKDDLEKRNLDDAVITSAERTVKVKDFLKDFEKAIDTLKDRFKPEYAATPETLALLRKGSDVELRNRRQGENATSSSAWVALASKLETLSKAYDVGWPLQSMEVRPSRLNDRELSAKVQKMENAAKALKSETDKAAKANKTIDKATRESLKTSIEKLGVQSKDVRSRIEDDRPGAVEVGALLAQATSVRDAQKTLALATANAPAWRDIDAGTEALARAYELKKP